MTTKVHVTCPETSHWNLIVTTEDQVWDADAKKMTGVWAATGQAPVVLKPTEVHETYIHSSRRLVVSEGDPVPAAG
ncbi:MAG: hypothetical protein V4477_16890 [Pseudomonadota bacterium]